MKSGKGHLLPQRPRPRKRTRISRENRTFRGRAVRPETADNEASYRLH